MNEHDKAADQREIDCLTHEYDFINAEAVKLREMLDRLTRRQTVILANISQIKAKYQPKV